MSDTTTPPRYPTSIDHRSPESLDEAIGDYLWVIENVPGYSWNTEYDIAKLRIAEQLIANMGLPRGPSREAEEERQASRARNQERRAYYQAHPEERPLPPVNTETRIAVFIRDRVCQHCGSEEKLTIDHKKPRSKGGTNDLSNLQVLCFSCNSRKGARE